MATGRQMKLVGQIGQYLVAAEFGRRGLFATTFTGNDSDYDIIASTEEGKHISVQVKTIRGPTWQFVIFGSSYRSLLISGRIPLEDLNAREGST